MNIYENKRWRMLERLANIETNTEPTSLPFNAEDHCMINPPTVGCGTYY